MKFKFKKLISAAIACAFLTGNALEIPPVNPLTATAATSVVNNPIIWSDVPDDDVIRVGDTYYMVSTTMFFSPGAPIMKSKDLVSWEICNYVYDTYANGDTQNLTNGKHDYAHGQWAASLRYYEGTYYVFFGSYGSNQSYIYKTDDIENGTWTRSAINGMYHDASMMIGDNGRNYLVYGGGGEIKIKELNSEMTGFKNGGVDQTIIKTGLSNLAGEGSHIQKIGDYYYVFLIAWPNGSGRIELCYRSKNITGPYEGKTVLNSNLGSYGGGVAQGGIVDTPDGKWWGLLFEDHGSVGRVPVLVPVTWQDNWPIMGVNGKAPVTITVDGDYKGTHLAVSDDFTYDANKLKLEWQWNHNPDNSAWSVTDRPGFLRLYNKSKANDLLWARNTLTMRTEGPACTSWVKLDTSGMKNGDHAGLSAFQFNYGNIGVYIGNDGSRHVYMAKNGGYSSGDISKSSTKIIAEKNISEKEIYLKVDFKFNNVDGNFNSSGNIDKANFYYSTDGNNWTKLGEELGMTYDLKMFTGYRSALYSYPTQNTGGYADFDYFEYERADWNVPVVIDPDENGYYYRNTFEGKTDSWSGRGSASVAVSGDVKFEGEKSLFVSGRESAWNGASRALPAGAFKAGETYSFSANIMYPDGEATDTFYMKIQYQDASGETIYDSVSEVTATKGEWIQLANTAYTIPSDASNVYIYIETAESTVDFYIDDAIGAIKDTEIPGAGTPDIEFLLGDLDDNGIVNAIDLTLAKRGCLEGKFDSKAHQLAADMNADGSVDAADIEILRDYIIGKTTKF